MADGHEKWNNDEIASHLKSAVETLTPNVLDQIDLSAPQLLYMEPPRRLKTYRRMHRAVTAAAACLCIAALYGGGVRWQNTRVESVIGLDVNPSIEISVNRKDEILEAEPLNDDGAEVLADMDLDGVDLNIGVNAIIGSMVRCGYLDELDNAILVTVSNDDREKASVLRQDVVTDIESSLEAHKVNAVVYDQQATDMKEITEISNQYGISYGKACFLYELVEENGLTEKELESFAAMTMEEIAKEIADRSYQVGTNTGREEPPAGTTVVTRPETSEPTESQTEESSSESQTPSETQSAKPPASSSAAQPPSETEDTEEDNEGGRKARIDYVDYYEGILEITFKEKVKWKNPTVSVTDADGSSCSARITDTGSDSCQIEISGIVGGESYTVALNGVKPRENGSYSSVKAYFDAPDISGDAMENGSDEPENEENITKPSESLPEPETSLPEETQPETETGEGGHQAETQGDGESLPKQTEPSEAETGI